MKERENVNIKIKYVTLIQVKNNDKSYDGKCFYKHIALLFIFLCSTQKNLKENLEMFFFWLNLNTV